MQFTMDAREGLASGAITVTFRNWQRPLARVGSHHKVGDTVLAIDRVDRVRVGDITVADATRAGGTVNGIRRRLAGRAPRSPTTTSCTASSSTGPGASTPSWRPSARSSAPTSSRAS